MSPTNTSKKTTVIGIMLKNEKRKQEGKKEMTLWEAMVSNAA